MDGPTHRAKETIMSDDSTPEETDELEPCYKAHDAEQSRNDEIEEACDDFVG